MSDAIKMVANMKRGVLTHGQSTVGRSENLFLSTLSAEQSAKYFKWYASNGDRLEQRSRTSIPKQEALETDHERTLSGICKLLHDVLRIPDNEHMSTSPLEELVPATPDL